MEVRPLEGLTKKLQVLLKLSIAITAIAVLAGFFEYYTYKTLPIGFNIDDEFLVSDAVTGIVGLIQFVLFIILGITFLRWIYRANKNLHILGGEQMNFSPGWSIGWYFIPIANLFKPYQAMKEIWNISHKNKPTTYTILGWWWFLWLVSSILGKLAFKISMKADDTNSYVISTITYIVSDGIDIVLNFVALMLVVNLWAAYSKNFVEQTSTQDKGSAGATPSPVT